MRLIILFKHNNMILYLSLRLHKTCIDNYIKRFIKDLYLLPLSNKMFILLIEALYFVEITI